MSKWKVTELPDGTLDLKLEDLDNVEQTDSTLKMDYESGKLPPDLPPYSCRIGNHNWTYYIGLTECYWFCKDCDKKDKEKKPPKRK